MKKMIAILATFALIGGAAFAQVTVSGAVQMGLQVVENYSTLDGKDQVFSTRGNVINAYVQLSGQSSEGTVGGLLRFRNQDMDGSTRYHRAFAWWRPNDLVKVWLGIDADGINDTSGFSGWAFHGGNQGGELNASASDFFIHDYDVWRTIYPGNFDTAGLDITLTAIEDLTLGLVLPIGNAGGWPRHNAGTIQTIFSIEDTYPGRLQFRANYRLDVASINLVWMGPVKNSGDTWEKATDYGLVGLNADISAVEGIPIQVGVSTRIPKDGGEEDINVGFATGFNGDGWGVKFRIGAFIPMADNADAFITGTLLPSFSVGNSTVLVDIGLKTKGDLLGWWVNPAIRIPIGGATLFTGVRIWGGDMTTTGHGGDGNWSAGNDNIYIAVPFTFGYTF